MRFVWLVLVTALFLTSPTSAKTARPMVRMGPQSICADSCVLVGIHSKNVTIVFHHQYLEPVTFFRAFNPWPLSQAWTADCHGVAFGPQQITDIGQIFQDDGNDIARKYRQVSVYLAGQDLWLLAGNRQYRL